MMDPYFDDGQVQLYCGDFREVLPALGLAPGAVDLVVTDPPYGETAIAWDRWPQGWPGAVSGYARSMWCFGSMRMFLDHCAEFSAWRMSQDIVWEKPHGTGFAADRFKRVHEHAVHWYRGPWRDVHHATPRVHVAWRTRGNAGTGKVRAAHTGKINSGIWTDDGTRLVRSVVRSANMWRRGAINETEKPLAVLTPLIQYGCPPGGSVLDVFAGSCSTLVAARALGRRGIGIELREEQCERAVRERLAQGVLDFGGAL
jgi:site-specific DNA-methyltransferase (adenine-specific)